MVGKKCPFVDRLCIEDDCMGWYNNNCFIRLLSKEFVVSATRKPSIQSLDTVIEHVKQFEFKKLEDQFVNQKFRIGLDFGTALSKLQLRELENSEIRLLMHTDRATHVKTPLVIPSVCYLSKSGMLFFGEKAEEQFKSDLAQGSLVGEPIRSIKKMLLRQDILRGERLHLPDIMNAEKYPGIKRNDYQLETYEIIGYMLGFMFSKAEKAIKEAGCINPEIENLVIPKNFAIPSRGASGEKIFVAPLPGLAFEKRTYSDFLRDVIRFAEHIAPRFDGHDEIHIDELRDLFFKYLALLQNKEVEGSTYSNLCNYTIEPMAVMEDLYFRSNSPRDLYGAIDVGAGTTDIAFFYKDSLLYENSCDLGGDDIDDRIKEFVAKKYLEKGFNFKDEEFLLERYYLEIEGRKIKELAVANGASEFNPRMIVPKTRLYPIQISLKDVENSIEDCLKKLSNFVKQSIEEAKVRCAEYKISVGKSILTPRFLSLGMLEKVFLFGGGSLLPPVQQTIKSKIKNFSTEAEIELMDVPKRYANELTRETYMLLAISLGVSRPGVCLPPFPFPPKPFRWAITDLTHKEVQ